MKKFLAILSIVLSLMGTVTFAMFIMEEAFQTVMFGTWAAQDAQDWKTVKDGVTLLENLERTLSLTNKYAGWIQPLAYISYGAYIKSERYYISALKAKVIAHRPDLFIGERITIEIVPTSVSVLSDKYVIRSKGITVEVNQKPNLNKSVMVTGTLVQTAEGVLKICDNL